MPRFWNFSLVFLRPDDSPVFCVGNFVISRLCKLFFLVLQENERASLQESGRKVLSSLAATTQSLLLLKTFSLRFSKLAVWVTFLKKVIFGNGHWEENLLLFIRRWIQEKCRPEKSSVTWLATGSRMDSMVFVWKTGIVWRWTTNYQRKHSETSIFLADSLNSKSTSERILLETPIFIFSDSVLHKFRS